MSTIKHTPGPLSVSGHLTSGFAVIEDAEGREVARVTLHETHGTHATYQRARLFSAAPELLAALRAIEHMGGLAMQGCSDSPGGPALRDGARLKVREAWDTVRAAIAKAEGC